MERSDPRCSFSRGRVAAYLTAYGVGHALIDAICAGILLTIWWYGELPAAKVTWLFLYYNLLAFGSQPVFGAILDHTRTPRCGAVLGCLFTGAALVGFVEWPTFAVTLAGVGNALFHLGAGTISLNLTPGRATAPGIFVAPGALGLAIGIYLGKIGQFPIWPFLAVLVPVACLIGVLKPPAIDYERGGVKRDSSVQWLAPALLLVLTCVAIRALVGTNLVFPWKSQMGWLIALTLAVVLGKGLGGYLADRYGWTRVAAGALALSIPLLAFAPGIAGLAIIGALLFNMTMPVTLAATANLLRGRPGLAFGLTCLALEVGAWPGKLHLGKWDGPGSEWLALAVMVTALVALYFGLRLAFTRLPGRFVSVRA
jgi:FSR family fosmidomycin resistance protein-like MFS transporter